MEEQILAMLAEVCDTPEIMTNPQLDLLDSELLDSLALILLLNQLEDEFYLEIQPTQVPRERWRTPASIIHLVKEQLAQTQALN